jgi:signal transduction histidine kinase
MNTLISDIARAFEYQIKKTGITLQIDPLPSCCGDETQINQVISNLLDNALKYLDPTRPGNIRISGKAENGQVIYYIEDNGIGIAAEHQDKIYEIFHRLNPAGTPGEGLGLTIVRLILDRHSGKIWVASEPGKGSTFFISLPTI